MKQILLINRKKYSGKGRPKNIDYFSVEKSKKILAKAIGQPINIKYPVPNIMEYIK